MKPNPKLLEQFDVEVTGRTPTTAEHEEMSRFIEDQKRNAKRKRAAATSAARPTKP